VYDADGERAKRTVTGTGISTYYMGGLYELEVPPAGEAQATHRYMYAFNGQTIAQREIAPDPPTPTPTPTNTPTNTPTATATNTPTNTPTPTAMPSGCQAVSWTNLVNVTTVSPGNTINKSSGADGWNGGAISTQSIPAGSDGWVQSVAVDRTKHTIFGLSNGDGGQDYTDIDFAIHLQGEAGWPGDLVIFEGGAEKHRINSTQQNPAYVAGDVLKVAVTGGVVKYYKNEVLLYTSQNTPVFPLLLDASVFHMNAKVQDAWLCTTGGGADTRPGNGPGAGGTTPTKQGTTTSTATSTATSAPATASASSKITVTPNPTSIYRGGTPSATGTSGTPSTPGTAAKSGTSTTATPSIPRTPQQPQNPQRPNSPNTVNTIIYLHTDHLGSVSVATNASGTPVSSQEYDPWGKVRSNGVTQTKVNYTGQKLDDTGLLYYHARMYDPQLGRFVSPDSIVPGASSGVGGAGGTIGNVQNPSLTVDYHESIFIASASDKKTAPLNVQALNRYAYVLNNPLRYTDPTGHDAERCAIGNCPQPTYDTRPTPSKFPTPYEAGPEPWVANFNVDTVTAVTFFLEILANKSSGSVMVSGNKAVLVGNLSRRLREFLDKVLKDKGAHDDAMGLIQHLLDSGDLGSTSTIDGLIELGGSTNKRARVLLRRITDIEGKPAFEIVAIFRKADYQGEVKPYLKQQKIIK